MMPPSSSSSSSKIMKSTSRPLLLNVASNGGKAQNDNPVKKGSFQLVHLNPNATTRAIGSLAIVGGTVSIYSAALSHSATTLTPLSVIYLVLLALNYSVMPRISKKYVSPKVNKESVALVEEIVKMSMGFGGFILTECSPKMNTNFKIGHTVNSYYDNFLSATSNWSIESSILAAGLPSALYAVQGVLTYTSYQNLDSVTFNGLTQVKTLSAAFCCYLVMGKVQSKMQLVALALLTLSTLIFQGVLDQIVSHWFGSNTMMTKTKVESSSGIIDRKKRFFLGIVPCLAATLLSGLAGAFSQKSLQTVVRSMERNAYFFSAEISFFSAFCLLLSIASQRLFNGNQVLNRDSRERIGYFDYWTWQTLIPIAVKATGGILTALVHKHSGSVMKGFSLVLGLVFSALMQTLFDGENLTGGQTIGTVLVLLSSWLHFTNPSAS